MTNRRRGEGYPETKSPRCISARPEIDCQADGRSSQTDSSNQTDERPTGRFVT